MASDALYEKIPSRTTNTHCNENFRGSVSFGVSESRLPGLHFVCWILMSVEHVKLKLLRYYTQAKSVKTEFLLVY